MKVSCTVLKTSQVKRFPGLVQQDQGGSKTRGEIREIFGDGVVEIIDGCTECDTVPKPPWKERKLKYLSRREASRLHVVRRNR